MGCSYLDGVIVPRSVKRVGAGAFKNCTGFSAAQIEHVVESLGDEAFYGDWCIAEVDIPSTVINIGVNAFGGDSSIIRIGLRGDSRMESAIFSNYKNIREATVKYGNGNIVDGLFKGCSQLTDVHFQGNCHGLIRDGVNLYDGTTSSLVTYVEQTSTGWDGTPGSHSLPQAWPLTGSFRTFRLDSLAFSDGVEKTWINGNKDWAHIEFEVEGKGNHVLEWTYAKDESGYSDPDCGWVSEVVWTPRLETINDYLNCTNVVFSSDAVAWSGVTDVSHDGFGAMRSGAIGDNAESRIDVVVDGAGTISFWWRSDCEASFKTYVLGHLSFFVDGGEQDFVNGHSDWAQKTFHVNGDGTHTLSWVYVKDEEGVSGADCAWLNEVVWTPTGTLTGLEAWLAERNLTADARAANGRTAAECYALGLYPADATNDFRIFSIELVNSKPKVEWEPKVNRWTGAEIQAVLKGAERLDGEWKAFEGATAAEKAAMRFFKVVVVVQ